MGILTSAAFVSERFIDNDLDTCVAICILPTHDTDGVQLSNLELKNYKKI